jgi:hypothetical protein
MIARSGGAGELGEVVGGADQRPFGPDFLEAAQQELPEPSGLLDLSEHRLDDLLPEPVSASPSGPLQLVPHGLGQRACDVPFDVGGVLGASRCEVSADLALGQGRKVGFAAVPGIGGGFLGPAAEIVLDPVDERHHWS